MTNNKQKNKILYYGPNNGNSLSRFKGMKKLGFNAEFVFEKNPVLALPRLYRAIEFRLKNGPVTYFMNKQFFNKARKFNPNILWVEMGRSIYASILKEVKEQTGTILVNTYSDDFLDTNSKKLSTHYNKSIPLYDIIFTPRKVNFKELYSRGAKKVDLFWKGYDPEILYPEKLSSEDIKLYGTDVVFIGHYEPSRAEPFLGVTRKIQNFKIWGNSWHKCKINYPENVIQYRRADNDEYRKAICGSKIAIQMLSKWARDVQSSRSFEIPACGVLMLAERTDEHLNCFEEGKEAVFYSSTEEMIDKIKYYLKNDSERECIAAAGRERCIKSGYSNYERLKMIMQKVLALRE